VRARTISNKLKKVRKGVVGKEISKKTGGERKGGDYLPEFRKGWKKDAGEE